MELVKGWNRMQFTNWSWDQNVRWSSIQQTLREARRAPMAPHRRHRLIHRRHRLCRRWPSASARRHSSRRGKSSGGEGRMTTSSGVTARRREDDTTGRTTTSSGVTARRRQDKSSASAAKMTSQRSREVPAAPHQGGRREIERGAAGPRGRRRTSTVREDPYLKFTEQDLVGEETN
jgi:hypothetical protein